MANAAFQLHQSMLLLHIQPDICHCHLLNKNNQGTMRKSQFPADRREGSGRDLSVGSCHRAFVSHGEKSGQGYGCYRGTVVIGVRL